MENKTYIEISDSPEYLASLTADEKKVIQIRKDFPLGHYDYEWAAKLGFSANKFSRLSNSIQGKRFRLGNRTQKTFAK